MFFKQQAYHVTDISMSYFGPTCIREHLRTLILQHCWELSNQGVVSLAHGLPNLTTLSLSGCSKVSWANLKKTDNKKLLLSGYWRCNRSNCRTNQRINWTGFVMVSTGQWCSFGIHCLWPFWYTTTSNIG